MTENPMGAIERPSTSGADRVADGDPRPGRWARFAARFRRGEEAADLASPAAEAVPEPVRQPARITLKGAAQTSIARRIAVVLAVLLAAVIAVAFRGSWTSQSDAARAAHFDPTGAFLYPFAPDGLIVLALVGAVVLRHKFWPRLYCLAVVVLFTVTSYVVNHLHGMGTFIMVGEGADAALVKPLDGEVVGLIAGQLVGSIAFGSHILMHVFRHLFPEALDGVGQAVAVPAGTSQEIAGHPDQGVPADPDAEREERKRWAAITVRMLLDNKIKPTRKRLAAEYGISDRQAGYVISDVEAEREADAGEEAHSASAAQPVEPSPPTVLAAAGSANGHGPKGGA